MWTSPFEESTILIMLSNPAKSPFSLLSDIIYSVTNKVWTAPASAASFVSFNPYADFPFLLISERSSQTKP